jgi:hypothetical protein
MQKKFTAFVSVASLVGSLALGVGVANAQATRTWVSGVGDDVNPCSRTAPCKTFAGAISKTAAGGEIDCLDPGGFGSVTITKSMTLNCFNDASGGGSILASGTNGINVNASSTDIVNLIGLNINGAGPTIGVIGINIVSAAKVSIQDSYVFSFSNSGILVQPTTASMSVDIVNTRVFDNPGNGILFKPQTGATASIRGTIDRSFVSNNGATSGDNIMANANLTTGSVKVTVNDTDSMRANTGNGFAAYSNTGGIAEIDLNRVSGSDDTTGIGVAGAKGTVRMNSSFITSTPTAVSIGTGGTAITYGNNVLNGAISGGSLTAASPGLQ